jgi:hypothetical protein
LRAIDLLTIIKSQTTSCSVAFENKKLIVFGSISFT